ncbi:MAG: prepilin-type N-terminal cleavage/methylation domain-containing protein [Tepidisphaeraceae bacterium]
MSTLQPRRRGLTLSGFTLVELLVVIGIIALLISILLPTLSRAREAANTVKCASNLRSVGQGMSLYVAENKGTLPAAYIYAGMQLNGTTQTPDAAINGYVHWSSYLYKKGRGSTDPNAFKSASGWEAFQCPNINNGGLPPTNTSPENLDGGQMNDNGTIVDQQAPRCAFTINEALCPRNKFVVGFQGAARRYAFVRAGQVKNSGGTILAAEWHQNWRIVADTGRSDPNSTVCKSHRPVHGFAGLSGELNMELLPPDAFGGRPTYRRAKVSDLGGDPQAGSASSTRLDWIGRNHDKRKMQNNFDIRRSNFLYLDGHVETKGIRETLEPKFEWGEKFYSLVPNSDFAP